MARVQLACSTPLSPAAAAAAAAAAHTLSDRIRSVRTNYILPTHYGCCGSIDTLTFFDFAIISWSACRDVRAVGLADRP
eukprot:6667736-Pyramimonas_sp.AAC.1